MPDDWNEPFHLNPQVRFALSSSSVFSRTDSTTDSERFYESILELLEDIDEQQEVNDLLKWWNMWAISKINHTRFQRMNILPTGTYFPIIFQHVALQRRIPPCQRFERGGRNWKQLGNQQMVIVYPLLNSICRCATVLSHIHVHWTIDFHSFCQQWIYKWHIDKQSHARY